MEKQNGDHLAGLAARAGLHIETHRLFSDLLPANFLLGYNAHITTEHAQPITQSVDCLLKVTFRFSIVHTEAIEIRVEFIGADSVRHEVKVRPPGL